MSACFVGISEIDLGLEFHGHPEFPSVIKASRAPSLTDLDFYLSTINLGGFPKSNLHILPNEINCGELLLDPISPTVAKSYHVNERKRKGRRAGKKKSS